MGVYTERQPHPNPYCLGYSAPVTLGLIVGTNNLQLGVFVVANEPVFGCYNVSSPRMMKLKLHSAKSLLLAAEDSNG